MKPKSQKEPLRMIYAAAFGRLCVETEKHQLMGGGRRAAAFGRLCVETVIV